MIDDIIKKIGKYNVRLVSFYDNFINITFSYGKYIYKLSKNNVESIQLKIKVKKYYIKLGSYVAKEFIFNGHSDFSLDEKFKKLNEKIKFIKIRLEALKNK